MLDKFFCKVNDKRIEFPSEKLCDASVDGKLYKKEAR